MSIRVQEYGDRLIGKVASAYVILWIYEGAARKWLPGADALMYVARDALLILVIIFLGITAVKARKSGWWFWVLAIVLGSIACFQIIASINSPAVAIIGLRSYLAPLLLPYLIWRYGQFELVGRLARIIVISAPLQLLLIILQVVSPANALVNLKVGGEDATFVNFGVVRASGTFSSPAGLTLYLALSMAVSLALVLMADKSMKSIAWIGVLSNATASLLAGSRGAVLAILIIVLTFLWLAVAGRIRGSLAKGALLVALGLAAWGIVSFSFDAVLTSFIARFETASMQEDSTSRVLEQAFGFISVPIDFLGNGIGAHAQAGINAGSGLLWVEIENNKWVAELGWTGLLLVLVKISVVGWLVARILVRPGAFSPLAVLALGALVPVLLWGQITQFPTAQGFVAIAITLIVGSSRSRRGEEKNHDEGSALRTRGAE